MVPALFLHSPGHLDAGGGGVQACSREYFAALERAGFGLIPVEIPPDRRIVTRLRRRFSGDPYSTWIDTDDAVRRALAAAREPGWVFINQHYLGTIAPALKKSLPERTRFVMLSHGLESTDFLHELREIGGGPPPGVTKRQATMLGWRLIQEARQARAFDHVFCLSEFEREIEHWLGSESVSMIPRSISRAPIDWRPEGRRLGFVGTLDHQPNREGLELFLRAYEALGIEGEVRVVGGPDAEGIQLAEQYRSVRYLGRLSNALLEAEARTWSCFVHPIFCYARGASTKLATALSWEIPIATTSTGRRGYTWRRGELPTANEPIAFAKLAASMFSAGRAAEAREDVRKVAASSPTIDDVGDLIASILRRHETDLAI